MEMFLSRETPNRHVTDSRTDNPPDDDAEGEEPPAADDAVFHAVRLVLGVDGRRCRQSVVRSVPSCEADEWDN